MSAVYKKSFEVVFLCSHPKGPNCLMKRLLTVLAVKGIRPVVGYYEVQKHTKIG